MNETGRYLVRGFEYRPKPDADGVWLDDYRTDNRTAALRRLKALEARFRRLNGGQARLIDTADEGQVLKSVWIVHPSQRAGVL